MLELLFFCIFTSMGAFVAFTHNLIPPIAGLASWQTSLIGGGLTGTSLCWITMRVSSTVTQKLDPQKWENLLSGGVLAILGASLGVIFYFGSNLLFPSTYWLQMTQGSGVLILTLLGFKIGYGSGLSPISWGKRKEISTNRISPKLLDTSVIIDGRIGDLVKSGFVEGTIVIPQFILDELHNIADSSDSLRRRKGRRGLDILGEMRKSDEIRVETIEKDYRDIEDVDRKLIQLAKELNAQLLTTDFNLNKVVQVEDLSVLNINELANAVKPKFIPGEELNIEVLERGEEIGQGVGYLDDGTMVVVENGRRFIGKKITAKVKSSLQTEAGKMLFVKPLSEDKSRWNE